MTTGLIFPKQEKRKKRKIKHPSSILQMHDGRCFICILLDDNNFFWPNIEKHHVFGGPNRTASEEEGLTVDLCPNDHRISKRAVHNNRGTDLLIKKYAQAAWEQNHTRGEFRGKFGKSYL